MNSFKKSLNGMSLMEVMFALAIAGLILTPIFITQGSSLSQVYAKSYTIRCLIKAQEVLYKSEIASLTEEPIKEEQAFSNPNMRIRYSISEPMKESALAAFDNISLQKLTWEWEYDREKQHDTLVTLVYKEKKKELT